VRIHAYPLPGSLRSLILLWIIGIIGCSLFTSAAPLQAQSITELTPGSLLELRAGPTGRLSHIGRQDPQRQSPSIATATFIVTYNGFSPQAQAAFQAAVDIWSTKISSAVPIRINANWIGLGSGVLGSAGAKTLIRNFVGAPQTSTYYPVALATKLAGIDLIPADYDITANFSSAFPNWYYGTDGNTPANSYDLLTVVLHEIGHGLGFAGTATVNGSTGSWGLNGSPLIYDRFIVNGSGQAIINTALFANPSVALGNQLKSNDLLFNGPNAVAAAGERPKLYAPASWQQGSSYSHLDDDYYPEGDPNSLMTPSLSQGESILNPGTIMLGIFSDLGWASTPLVLNNHVYLPLITNT